MVNHKNHAKIAYGDAYVHTPAPKSRAELRYEIDPSSHFLSSSHENRAHKYLFSTYLWNRYKI